MRRTRLTCTVKNANMTEMDKKQTNKQQRVDRQSLQGPYPQLFVCHFPSAMHSSENCTYRTNLLFLLGMQIWHLW